MVDLYEKIVKMRQEGHDLVLVTVIDKVGEGPSDIGKKMLVVSDELTFGTVGGGSLERYALKRSQDVFKTRTHLTEKYTLDKNLHEPYSVTLPMVCGGSVTLFYEFIGVRNFVYIFGGGHVGAALCKVLTPLNFHVTIIDERKNIIDEFVGGDAKVFSKFTNFIDEFGIKDNSFVVVCTPSHLHDYHVINKIIEKKLHPKYVGMLCSLEKLYEYLDATYQIFGRDVDLSYFYAPIGLELGGGSPEDIALSIASEILSLHHGVTSIRHMREKTDAASRYW